MNRHDLTIGIKVHHTTFPHWGEGEVVKFRDTDIFGYKMAAKYRVKWSGLVSLNHAIPETWCRASELRKTLNAKKIAMMTKLKELRR